MIIASTVKLVKMTYTHASPLNILFLDSLYSWKIYSECLEMEFKNCIFFFFSLFKIHSESICKVISILPSLHMYYKWQINDNRKSIYPRTRYLGQVSFHVLLINWVISVILSIQSHKFPNQNVRSALAKRLNFSAGW